MGDKTLLYASNVFKYFKKLVNAFLERLSEASKARQALKADVKYERYLTPHVSVSQKAHFVKINKKSR